MHDGPVAWVRAVDVEGYPTHNLPFESHNVLKILYEFAKAERAGTMSLCGPLLTTVSHQRVLGLPFCPRRDTVPPLRRVGPAVEQQSAGPGIDVGLRRGSLIGS